MNEIPPTNLAWFDLHPTDLRCEYLENPIGIGEMRPRLSWALTANRRDQHQSGYQIQVSSDSEALEADLWDSGRVASSESLHIVYEGLILESRQCCHWRVRVWDGAGKASDWSAVAQWELALLKREDWSAVWIGLDEPLGIALPDTMPPSPQLRRSFTLPSPPVRARLYITARGIFEARLNGRHVSNQHFAPGWTDYASRLAYQTYDVTDLLSEGENVLGAVIGDGWYSGTIGFKLERRQYGSRRGLLAQLEIELEGGERIIVTTNGDWDAWKASFGPIQSSDFLSGETYDARLETPGWDAPGFDARSWKDVATLPWRESLEPATEPPVRVVIERAPQTLSQPQPGAFIFDLGQNMVGWARLCVRGAIAGQEVRLRFAEVLDADGTLYVESLRGARCTDRFVSSGADLETFEPHFTFHGFRYVEVTGYPGEPRLEDLTGCVLSSDTPFTGSFECSNELVNRLQRNIVWGQRGNFLSVPTDCPQRDERLGWLGDAQIFAQTACFNAEVAPFLTKWLTDVTDAQSPSGAYPDVAPRLVTNGDGTPAWGDAGVIVPWTLYRHYADTRILERHWESMTRWMAYIAVANPDFVWRNRRNSDFGDWLAQDGDDPANAFGSRTPKDLLATAYWAYDASLMARMARATGREPEALEFDGLFERVKAAFQREYLHADGRVAGETQTGYVLALHFDLIPTELRPRAGERLVALIEARDGHLTTGFVGVGYLCPVLTAIGRSDVAYRLLLNESFPSWGYSIRHGATTIWERWDGWTSERGFQDAGMNSFTHYSLGSVGQWLFQTVAGIDGDPAQPGFEHIVLRPQPGGGITHASATLLTPRGTISSAWRLEGADFRLEIEIPANTSATLTLPYRYDRLLEGDADAASAAGVRSIKTRDGETRLELASGSYRFSALDISAIAVHSETAMTLVSQ
jgi:alpha-L-rhamnosidase